MKHEDENGQHLPAPMKYAGLSDAELAAIRYRDRLGHDVSAGYAQIVGKDRRALLAEIDRLRKLDRLAREWLRLETAATTAAETMEYDRGGRAREAYRRAIEEAACRSAVAKASE